MKNNERDERKTRKVLVPLATLAVAAAVAVGSGATWTSTTTNDVSVTAGSIIHSNNHDGFTLEVTKLLPGKTASGTVTIKNVGDLDSVLTLERTDATNGFTSGNLQLTISEVGTPDVAKVGPGEFPVGPQGATTPLDGTFTQNEKHTYRIDITLLDVAATTNDDQGKAASAAFEFKTVPVDSNAEPVTRWIP